MGNEFFILGSNKCEYCYLVIIFNVVFENLMY